MNFDMAQVMYDLDYFVEKRQFVICVRKPLQDFMMNLRPELPLVGEMLKQRGFSWAGNNLETGFGFIAQDKNKSPLTFLRHDSDSIIVTAEVPSVASGQFEECRYCYGTGKDRDGEDNCFACRGEKVRSIVDEGPLFALAATLNLIFCCGRATNNEVKTGDKYRLIDIDTMLERGFHGASLGGHLYAQLMKFLHSKKLGNTIEEIKLAMSQAHKMAEAGVWSDRGDDEFISFYEPSYHQFYMRCPGNACEVGSEMYQGKEIETAKFNCHNVDTITQQMCFLAGLATLCGAARKAGF